MIESLCKVCARLIASAQAIGHTTRKKSRKFRVGKIMGASSRPAASAPAVAGHHFVEQPVRGELVAGLAHVHVVGVAQAVTREAVGAAFAALHLRPVEEVEIALAGGRAL